MSGITKTDYVRLLIAPLAFIFSSFWLWFLVKNRPTLNNEDLPDLYFPRSIEDLGVFVNILSSYKQNHFSYLVILFSSAYIFKQTFAIPGSALLNLLSGALFGCWPLGYPLCCVLTAIGATNCFLLSKMTGKKILMAKFGDRIEKFKQMMEENKDKLLWYLISIRIFPASPNWLINITAPIVSTPIHTFFVSVLLGLMPYNFLCIKAGETLSEIKSFDDVLTPQRFLLLLLLALAMLTFSHFLGKKKTKHLE